MLRISIIITILFAALNASAADRYWIATTTANWNSTTNWSTTSGGAGGASVPGSADKAIFDGSGTGNCTIDATVSITTLDVQSGYTGTISQGSNTITVSGNGTFSGGTFSGGSVDMSVNGIYTLSGTAFTSTSGRFIVRHLSFTSGSFSHNNGKVTFGSNSTGSSSISGSISLYDAEFNGSTYNMSFNIASGTVLTVNHDLTYTGTSGITINTGTIDVKGNITLTNSSGGGGGTATIKISGTGSQQFTGPNTTNSSPQCRLPNIEIDKSSGTLSLKDFIIVSGNWKYVNGTVDAVTNNSTIYFFGTKTIEGTHTLNKVWFGGASASATYTISSGTVLTVTDTIRLGSTFGLTFDTGTIEAKGNILAINAAAAGGGTALFKINGTSDQNLEGPSSGLSGYLPNIEIAKSSGTLHLLNKIRVDGDWTYTSGTIDAGTSTVAFVNSKTITGTHSLYNVIFSGGTTSTYTIVSGTTLTVSGELQTDGSLAVTINTGDIHAQGNITINNSYSAASGGGTATITINGTGDQYFSGAVDLTPKGRLPNIVINKSSGTLYLQNAISVAGNWTYTAGTIDAVTGNSTVTFVNAKTITGSHTLYNAVFSGATNVTYTIASGTTLTLDGSVTYSSTNNIVLSTGTLVVKGDLNFTNTGTGGGGTALIKIAGTGNQTLTGFSGTSTLCRLPNVEIDKPSGTLFLLNTMTVAGNWTYTQGTIDAGTSTVIFFFTKTISGSHTLANVIFSGAANYTYTIASGTTLTVGGSLISTQTGFIILNTGTIDVKGDISWNNTSSGGTGGTAIINISGTGDQLFTGSGITNAGRLCNITIDKPSGTLTLNSIISCMGNWLFNTGAVDATTNSSTIVMCASATVDVQGTSSSMSFNNLTVNTGTTTVGGNLVAEGNLTINSSTTLSNSTYAIKVGGNWSNSGTFTNTSGTVTFNGTGTQTIIKSGAAETFYGLIIDKSSGTAQLNGPITVTNALTLTSGKVVTTSTNLLTLNNGATSTAGSDAGFVSGPMKKIGNAAFTFPLGETSGGANYYHPLSITAPSSGTDAFTAEYIATGYPNDSIMVDSLQYISDCEYWVITRNAGTSNVTATVGWNVNSCVLSNFADMIVAQWDGTKWASLGSSDIFVDTDKGTLKAGLPVNFAVAGPKNLTIGVAKNKSPYAELKHKLDGGYYMAYNGKLLFKYDEEYNDADSKLTFNIYDEDRNLVGANSYLPTGQQKLVSVGDNRYVINLINCYINLGNGFYVLEVTNEKNEKRYLRFKHQTSISIACPPSGPSPM